MIFITMIIIIIVALEIIPILIFMMAVKVYINPTILKLYYDV